MNKAHLLLSELLEYVHALAKIFALLRRCTAVSGKPVGLIFKQAKKNRLEDPIGCPETSMTNY